MSVKHILLTTDFSEDARRAYAPTAELASSLGAKITLLHVVQVLTKVPQGAMLAQPVVIGNLEEETESAKASMEKERSHFAGAELATEVITSDNVAHGVVEYARTHGADLIALSSHGRSGLRRMVLGSVAEIILRHAHTPVLTFPPPTQE